MPWIRSLRGLSSNATPPTSSPSCVRGSKRSGATAAIGRHWWWSPTTPSCSGTGGTKGPSSWSEYCGCCRKPACGWRHCRARSKRVMSRAASTCPRRRGDRGRTGVWDGEQVADLAEMGQRVQRRLIGTVDKRVHRGAGSDGGAHPQRRSELDQMAREALLALSSDWAFMVTKDSAASYARDRAGMHELRFRKLADGVGADSTWRPRRCVSGSRMARSSTSTPACSRPPPHSCRRDVNEERSRRRSPRCHRTACRSRRG